MNESTSSTWRHKEPKSEPIKFGHYVKFAVESLSYQIFIDKLSKISPNLQDQSPKPQMPYVQGNRQDVIQTFYHTFQENFIAHCCGSTDKQHWCQDWIYGPSGIGKTRMTMELLNLFSKLPPPQTTTMYFQSPNMTPNQQTKFSQLFQRPVTLIIDFLHNARMDWEKTLPTSVLLGLRVFMLFVFPKIKLDEAKQYLEEFYDSDPYSFKSLFELITVNQQIANGLLKPFGSDERTYLPPTVLHIGIDEIQELFSEISYEGTREISVALHSASVAAPNNMFVFTTLTGIMHYPMMLKAYDFNSNPQLLFRLDENSVIELAEKCVSKHKRPSNKVWSRTLEVCGGNPRILAQLFELLMLNQDPTFVPSNCNFSTMLDKLIGVVQIEKNLQNLLSDSSLILFVALTGVPILSTTQVELDKGELMSLREIQQYGGFRLIPMLADGWPSADLYHVEIEIPFIVLTSLLTRMIEKPNVLSLFMKIWTADGDPLQMERMWFHHFLLKFYTSSALLQEKKITSFSPTILRAFDLFYGAICTFHFQRLLFVPFRRIDIEYAANETHTMSKDKCLITLAVGRQFDVNKETIDPISIKFIGKTPFDALISMRYVPDALKPEQTDQILIWIDIVCSDKTVDDGKLTSGDVKDRIDRLDKMRKILPKRKQILLICSNKPSMENARKVIEGGRIVHNGRSTTFKSREDVALFDDSVIPKRINWWSERQRLDLVFGRICAPLLRLYDNQQKQEEEEKENSKKQQAKVEEKEIPKKQAPKRKRMSEDEETEETEETEEEEKPIQHTRRSNKPSNKPFQN